MNDVQKSNGFDEFWSEYPKKEDKQTAKALFEKAIKTTDVQEIMDGLQRYKEHRNNNEPWRAWMQAPRWLRNKRWQDEFAPKPTPKQEMEVAAAGVRWKERFEKDPSTVPQGIQRIFNLGPYAKGAE